MKKILLLVAIIVLSHKGLSQEPGQFSVHKIDSLSKSKGIVLDSTQFYQIIKKQFNSVVNSSGKTTIGNYASADIKDGHVAFNATKNFKNGNMLSLNASGGITDGFFAILNQSKINSNVGADIKLNLLLKSSSLSFYDSEIAKLNYNFSKADTIYKYSELLYFHKLISLQKKLDLLNIEIKTYTTQLGTKMNVIDSVNLVYEIAKKNNQADSLMLKLRTLKSVEDESIENKKIRKKAKEAAVNALSYTSIHFQWISIGAGFQNNSFNQFRSSFMSLDSQVIKQNYTTWGLTVEWNLYNWNHYSAKTYYLLIGGKLMIDDNFSDLSKIELNDTHQYGDTINQRFATKKIPAYNGDYQTKLLGAKFYFDFYKFFLDNTAAIHFFPEVNYKQHCKPLYNAGLGLLYSFQDAKDNGNEAKLNAELYFELADLTNKGNSNLTLFGRNEFGLRLSIPVSFFNF